ncbi:hypothetical protein AALP_AA2G170500 [Arabis alpina]|uniref:EF-hand domain-containing protein n=1 Tax=Arabis alpina TaxID=50452 RepID=A0A087HI22_ARAAL|nr:hypothetical protein AALP_AA2G170500 [Arabis alpina]
MESIGEKITGDELKEMIREVDLDGNGRLKYDDEFAKVMMAKMDVKVRYFATDVTLSKEEEEEMRERFMVGDKDRNGFITEAEFRYVMTRDGSKITDDEVNNIIRGADVDGDGQLSYDEFVKLMIKMDAEGKYFATDVTLTKEEEEEMRGRFRSGDVNNDGFITAEELLYAVRKTGAKITEADVKNAIGAVDDNGDGRLSYDEFVKYMMTVKMFEEAAKGHNLVTNVDLSREDENTLRQIYVCYDVDKDGFISAAEFQRKWENVTDEDVSRLVKKYDADGDGRLNYDEYVKIMMEIRANAATARKVTAYVSQKVNRFVKFVVKTFV